MGNLTSTRREFMAALPVIAVAPKFLYSSAGKTTRILLDPCNGTPLAGVRIKLKNLDSGKKASLITTAEGSWTFDLFIADIVDQEGHRIRASISPLSIDDIQYAGLEHRFIAYPGGASAKANRTAGHLSLIPLSHPGRGVELDDDDLNAAWPDLLSDCLFSSERTPLDIPKNTVRGALTAFSPRRLHFFLGESLSVVEQEFVREEILAAVETLSAGKLRTKLSGSIPEDQEPFFADQVPAGGLMVVKRPHYPKPSTRIRYGENNPHEIVSAAIFLDSYTLNGLFREGAGGAEEISLARHLVQRAVAEALGFRPTMRLPNRTLLDANFTPQAALFRRGIRSEDLLLARVLYGSGWLGPGARLSADGTVFISNGP